MIALSARNVSKRYRLSGEDEPNTLRDKITKTIRMAIRGSKGQAKVVPREFLALDDISFDLEEGDRLGLIGRNGAGKSTLLKVLSRITPPTKGEIRIRGRVGSLLEVGTGFHPELTGRENIYLNGSILGLTRREIRRKFDEIVDFSEIGQFIDMPVKRYSSGMHVRLAFAIAAHLEPEILILDEVLAVGDVAFQKKCLGKMEEVGREGRTVIFVTHSMGTVQTFCNRAILLDKGRKLLDTTDTKEAISEYMGKDGSNRSTSWVNSGTEYVNDWFVPIKLSLTDDMGRTLEGSMRSTDSIYVTIEGEVRNVNPLLTIGYVIFDNAGNQLYWSYPTDQSESDWPKLTKGRIVMRSPLPRRLLNEGEYRISLLGGIHYRQWLFEPGTIIPTVDLAIAGGLSDSPYWQTARPTLLAPVLGWEISQ